MNDRRNSDPISHSTSLNASSRRGSGSSQELGKRFQDTSSRSSGRHSTHQDRAKSLEQQPLAANRWLKRQELHADDAEEHILALAHQLKLVNDARVAAIQEASKASEELKLYKIQLHKAHQEIHRAQEILDKVDQERYDAEKAAAEARTLARRYRRDLLLIKAMQEGRQVGMQEGLEHGRALALLETDKCEDMDGEGSARWHLKHADAEFRPDFLGLGSNEEIIHSPQHPNLELAPQPSPQPIPVPPPEPVQRIPVTRSQTFRSPSPSLIPQPTSIPPDGYIPTIDRDNVIRLPPPHELAKPPPTPERPASPQLPEVSQGESWSGSRSHRHRQSNPSLALASTFSNAAGPLGRVGPLDTIPEAQSSYANSTPADGNTLGRQPSQISSYRLNSVNPEQGSGASRGPARSASIGRRASISSNVSASQALRTCSPNEGNHSKNTASVVPSRPLSSGTCLSQPGPSNFGAEENSHRTPEALPISMPGAYRDPTDRKSTREQPRPDSSRGLRPTDDDAASIKSVNTLTTTQARSNQSQISLV